MKSRPALYIAITNHGFGHVVRAASVANAVQKLNPEILLIFVTTAPRFLIESYVDGDFIIRPRAFDVGVVQSDSLSMDLPATLAQLKEICQKQNQIIHSEVSFIQLNQVQLILADIPPLAAKIAKAAGIPCWMMSNFGWDFIYRPWGGEFIQIADWIGECFSNCDLLYRLPLHEEMPAFPQKKEVGLTGGMPHFSPEEIREKLNLTTPKDKTILLSFGGLGLGEIPYQNLQQFPDWQFISFDKNAPELTNLVKVTDDKIRPVDIMPVCSRVITKPGYSTFSEALRLDTPIVSLTREGFAESPLLIEGLQNYGYHQIISPAQFFEEPWNFLHQEIIPPRLTEKIDKYGTETIAQAIAEAL